MYNEEKTKLYKKIIETINQEKINTYKDLLVKISAACSTRTTHDAFDSFVRLALLEKTFTEKELAMVNDFFNKTIFNTPEAQEFKKEMNESIKIAYDFYKDYTDLPGTSLHIKDINYEY